MTSFFNIALAYPCSKHPSETFTNYCCNLRCRVPLCPECIDEHNKEHARKNTYSEIDTLKRVKDMCGKKIQYMTSFLDVQLSRLNKYSDMGADDLIEEARKDLELSTDKLLMVVDQYFQELLQDYSNQVKMFIGSAFDFTKLIDEMSVILSELRMVEKNLETRGGMLESIDKTIRTSSDGLLNHYISKTNELLDTSLDLRIPVKVTDQELSLFRSELPKFVKVLDRRIGLPLEQDSKHGLQTDSSQTKSEKELLRYFKTKFNHL